MSHYRIVERYGAAQATQHRNSLALAIDLAEAFWRQDQVFRKSRAIRAVVSVDSIPATTITVWDTTTVPETKVWENGKRLGQEERQP
jgi:hypothetical protein